MSDVEPSLEGPPWEEDAPDVEERDPNTDDMFGAPEPAGMREAEAASAPEPAPVAETPAPKAPKKTPAADDGPAADAPGTGSDGEAYTVLARKYRPRTFEDLIGQEAMVRTLTNAFATGRIAHAFMLTG
ncbi:MAG TPA: DNA polymerase III subunit gamma/tau, partial [Brevundimonas sp.]